MTSDKERLARAALSRLVEPDEAGRFGRLLAAHTADELFGDLRAGRLADAAAKHWSARLRTLDVAADLRRAERVGARVVCPDDDEWPPRLNDLAAARPIVLWVRGDIAVAKAVDRSVAVVGSRACTSYGHSVATEFAAALAERGWTVVSGGAYGIDAAAHRGALAVGARTVAVLACGVDRPYPPSNRGLLERVADEGLLVSELPPGVNPTRGRFIVRNRLIAALTRGTLLVEASPRSGALSTASRARKLHRPTMGVPGPATSQTSAGVHLAIREMEAVLVTTAAEVIEVVGAIGDDLAPLPRGPERPFDHVPAEHAPVLEAIPARGAIEASEIAIRAGLAPDSVLAALGALLAARLVERVDGGFRLTKL